MTGNTRAVVYYQDGCTNCKDAAASLRRVGYDVVEEDFEMVQDDISTRNNIMAQLQLQDGAFPVVMINGEFFDPAAVLRVCQFSRTTGLDAIREGGYSCPPCWQ